MATETRWVTSVGFRHVIEDGLAILNGATIRADRKNYVLQDLARLLIQAKRGAELIQENALFVTSGDRTAYESYSFLDRHLSEGDEERWREMLKAAESTFDELRKDNPGIASDARKATITLLKEVLSSLARDPRPGIPLEPEEIRIGG